MHLMSKQVTGFLCIFIGECNEYKFNIIFGTGMCTSLYYEQGSG